MCLKLFVCLFVGLKKMVFSPHNLAINLTPSLMKTRRRFETMSAGSTTDTEGGISPLWESEEVGGVLTSALSSSNTFHILVRDSDNNN